ncbi:MAG: hypothetical protein HXO50_04340 [Prevotella sp.]|nr:hypothetical protein [Prevotella sp.]
MKNIDQRRIALAIVTFICTIACAQVPGDYISTHFKKGDTLQYTYKLSIKAEDPTTRKSIEIPYGIYENLSFSPASSYYLLNENRKSYESTFTLTVREVTPYTYTMRLQVQQSPYGDNINGNPELMTPKFTNGLLKEKGILITFNKNMSNYMPTNSNETINDLIDYLYAHREENELIKKFTDVVPKEDFKQEFTQSEDVNSFISLIINLSAPGLSMLPEIYRRKYTPEVVHYKEIPSDKKGSHPLKIEETTSFNSEGWLNEYNRTVTFKQPRSLIVSHESLIRQVKQ